MSARMYELRQPVFLALQRGGKVEPRKGWVVCRFWGDGDWQYNIMLDDRAIHKDVAALALSPRDGEMFGSELVRAA